MSVTITKDSIKYDPSMDGEWFPFDEVEGVEGFEIKLRFIPPKELKSKVRQFNRQYGETAKADKEYEKWRVQKACAGWRGLKIKHVNMIVPGINVTLGAGTTQETDVEFSLDLFKTLEDYSYAFSRWIGDIVVNEAKFSSAKKNVSEED